ncbi:MAG: hypothetical protein ACFFC7_03590 [Candidatus Hermodarchaeota archaeon]
MSRFDIRLGGMLLLGLLFLVMPISGTGLVPIKLYTDGFEDSFYQTTTWKEADTPPEFWYAEASIGSGISLEDFDWSINLTEAYSTYGDYSIELIMNGRYAEGVVWLERKFKLTETLPYITMSGLIYTHENFTNYWQVLIYIGTEDPVNKVDLRGPNNEGAEIFTEELSDSWISYRRTSNTTFQEGTLVYLAFGISIISEYNTNDSIYLDLFQISSVNYDWYTRQNAPGLLFIGGFIGLLTLSITIAVTRKKIDFKDKEKR